MASLQSYVLNTKFFYCLVFGIFIIILEGLVVYVKHSRRLNVIKFAIPRTTSLAELYLGSNARKLGIAIPTLEIISRNHVRADHQPPPK